MSLDVLALSAATASLQIVRNAELLKGIPSAKAFVYTTEMVSVGEWARPLIDPVVLLPASTAVPGGTTGRSAALTKIIAGWLSTLVENGPTDLAIRSSYVFDPVGNMPHDMKELGDCTVVPIGVLPGTAVSPTSPLASEFVDPANVAAHLAESIDSALPTTVHAPGAGVLIEISGFTHAVAGGSGVTSAERVVLRLRGLWIPIAPVAASPPIAQGHMLRSSRSKEKASRSHGVKRQTSPTAGPRKNRKPSRRKGSRPALQ